MRVECAPLPGDDVLRRSGPGERLWFGVVLQQVVVDFVLEIVDAGIAPAADALCGNLGEEALDEG